MLVHRDQRCWSLISALVGEILIVGGGGASQTSAAKTQELLDSSVL